MKSCAINRVRKGSCVWAFTSLMKNFSLLGIKLQSKSRVQLCSHEMASCRPAVEWDSIAQSSAYCSSINKLCFIFVGALTQALELLKVEKVSLHPVFYTNSTVLSYLRSQRSCVITHVKVKEDWGHGTALLHPARNIKQVWFQAPYLHPRFHTVA